MIRNVRTVVQTLTGTLTNQFVVQTSVQASAAVHIGLNEFAFIVYYRAFGRAFPQSNPTEEEQSMMNAVLDAMGI